MVLKALRESPEGRRLEMERRREQERDTAKPPTNHHVGASGGGGKVWRAHNDWFGASSLLSERKQDEAESPRFTEPQKRMSKKPRSGRQPPAGKAASQGSGRRATRQRSRGEGGLQVMLGFTGSALEALGGGHGHAWKLRRISAVPRAWQLAIEDGVTHRGGKRGLALQETARKAAEEEAAAKREEARLALQETARKAAEAEAEAARRAEEEEAEAEAARTLAVRKSSSAVERASAFFGLSKSGATEGRASSSAAPAAAAEPSAAAAAGGAERRPSAPVFDHPAAPPAVEASRVLFRFCFRILPTPVWRVAPRDRCAAGVKRCVCVRVSLGRRDALGVHGGRRGRRRGATGEPDEARGESPLFLCFFGSFSLPTPVQRVARRRQRASGVTVWCVPRARAEPCEAQLAADDGRDGGRERVARDDDGAKGRADDRQGCGGRRDSGRNRADARARDGPAADGHGGDARAVDGRVTVVLGRWHRNEDLRQGGCQDDRA